MNTVNFIIDAASTMLRDLPYSLSIFTAIRRWFLSLQALLKYIAGLDIPGAVLIFLPGWNLIFAIHKFLSQHPVFGKSVSNLVKPCLLACK